MPRIRTIVFSLALALLLYATLVAGIDAERTLAAMRQLDMRWWLAILALSLFNYGLRFARWHGYLRWLGDRVGLWRDGLIYIAGFALTTTPGKAGEGMRSVYLARHGVPYPHSLAAFFAERFIDLLAIALLSMLVLIAFSNYVWWVVAPLAALAGLLIAVRQRRLLEHMQRRTANPEGRLQNLLHGLVSAWDQAFALLGRRPLYAGLAIGLVAWAAEGVSLYVIAHGLDIELALTTAIGIYAVSMLVGALSFIPGGLGSTEAVMVLLLKLSGVDATTALAVTLIARVATLWFAVVLGLVSLAAIELDRRRAVSATNRNVSNRNPG
ncbi:flippase-like domain-containing protein [Endozoicomonas sp. G2_2]|uniref:lysylphosphatidylglycerol synthase transmembrane domain-containing protein n=1 Tax=Endozoicomonas sp. G2_2 TaxID=2821092 RepID=UPI001ADA430B|nr:lysylphosphatidylglycerol synthase transmembrane domain-containing protein [Endozoicomonas sp. G2_2]MBO9471392.1 flippase-like domain-containing protein [Endozoicomonas sp. G2_2]